MSLIQFFENTFCNDTGQEFEGDGNERDGAKVGCKLRLVRFGMGRLCQFRTHRGLDENPKFVELDG